MSNSGATQVTRNPDGTYPKGISGNPEGPGRGYKHMTTKLREAITKISEDTGEAADVAIVKAVIEGAKKGQDRKIELVWSYLDGKPPQALEHSGPDGGLIEASLKISFVKPL